MLSGLRHVLSAIDWLGKLGAYFAAVMVAAIAALIITEIFCRTFLNISLTFAWEFSAFFMGAAIFCAAGFTMRTGGHVRVSLLASAIPPWLSRGLELLATAFATVFACYIAMAMTNFAYLSWSRGSTTATFEATPLVYPQGAIAFGAILLALQLIARTIRLVIGDAPEDESERAQYNVE